MQVDDSPLEDEEGTADGQEMDKKALAENGVVLESKALPEDSVTPTGESKEKVMEETCADHDYEYPTGASSAHDNLAYTSPEELNTKL